MNEKGVNDVMVFDREQTVRRKLLVQLLEHKDNNDGVKVLNAAKIDLCSAMMMP